MRYIIQTYDVSKGYPCQRGVADILFHPFKKQKTAALEGVSLSIARSELTGIVGLNGAGKTTLCKILSGILLPDSGTVCFNGTVYSRDGVFIKQKTGFIGSDERGFYWRLTARQNLDFFAGLYGLQKPCRTKRIEELCGIFDMKNIDRRFSDYSSGYKERFALIKGLLHNPEVLIIDEPARNLDYMMREKLLRLIKQRLICEGNKAVIIGTNKLEDLEIFDKLIILDNGSIKAQGSLDELASLSGMGRDVRGIFEHYVAG
jgi:ABC-2 type transport system ATP-binding protein